MIWKWIGWDNGFHFCNLSLLSRCFLGYYLNFKSAFSIAPEEAVNIKSNLGINLEPTIKFKFWISSRKLDVFWFARTLGETLSFIFSFCVHFSIAFEVRIWIENRFCFQIWLRGKLVRYEVQTGDQFKAHHDITVLD